LCLLPQPPDCTFRLYCAIAALTCLIVMILMPLTDIDALLVVRLDATFRAGFLFVAGMRFLVAVRFLTVDIRIHPGYIYLRVP
jgi:hypothetical protein